MSRSLARSYMSNSSTETIRNHDHHPHILPRLALRDTSIFVLSLPRAWCDVRRSLVMNCHNCHKGAQSKLHAKRAQRKKEKCLASALKCAKFSSCQRKSTSLSIAFTVTVSSCRPVLGKSSAPVNVGTMNGGIRMK